jgi:hypothetical protein
VTVVNASYIVHLLSRTTWRGPTPATPYYPVVHVAATVTRVRRSRVVLYLERVVLLVESLALQVERICRTVGGRRIISEKRGNYAILAQFEYVELL